MSDDFAEECVLLNETDWARLSAIVQSARIPLINVGSGKIHRDNTDNITILFL